ncbi:putative nuclease HARBI1 [Pleurodeles waltl]|uniref:putative nuclease HARBI1 n=1 Tax=Pleurodeles waltl TaxID=8319 RepID=UPI0037093BFB
MRYELLYRPLVDLETMEERHIMMTYRLNYLTIRKLFAQLQPDLLPALRKPNVIVPTVQVLSVLHVLASGSFQVNVELAAEMSQPMFSLVLQDMLDALLKHVDRYLRVPQHPEPNIVKAAFYSIAHVPHVIGAINGTHIAVVPLRANEQVYRNRKSTYLINVQMVCLADQYMSHVTVKFTGSAHDSYVLRNSSVPALMLHLQRERIWLIDKCTADHVSHLFYLSTQSALCLTQFPNVLFPCLHYTGDSGYPTLPWLLIPVRYPTTDGEDRYNEAHSGMRRVIERTFGPLKARFCCLLVSDGALQYRPGKVCKIAVACYMIWPSEGTSHCWKKGTLMQVL